MDKAEPHVQPLASWWWLVALGCGLPFLVAFWVLAGEQFRGFVASLSVSVLVCVYGLFRQFRGSPSLWIGLLVLIAAHSLLVFEVKWINLPGPKIMALPFVLADLGISFAVVLAFIKIGDGMKRTG